MIVFIVVTELRTQNLLRKQSVHTHKSFAYKKTSAKNIQPK